MSGVSVKNIDMFGIRMFDEDKHAKYSLCALGHQPFQPTATDLNGVIT